MSTESDIIVSRGTSKPVVPARVRSAEERRAERKRRYPMDGLGLKLSVQGFDEPGYTLVWKDEIPALSFHDSGADYVLSNEIGRVGDGKDGNSSLDSRVSQIVGADKDGRPRVNYLMKIKTEWYEEDQAVQRRSDDATDEALNRVVMGNNTDGVSLKEVSLTRGPVK